MTTKSQRKERERFWLDCARAIRADLFHGEVKEGEAPDFVLGQPTRSLGVEITQYSRQVLPGEAIAEEQTGLKGMLLSLAKTRFAAQSSTHLRVGVVFAASASLRKRRVPYLADRIVAQLVTHLDGRPDWTHVRWEPGDEEKGDTLDEIASVYARVIPSVGNMHWYPADAGWVSHVGEEEIARIVAKKEPNVRQYRQRCDRLSLLIVFEGRPQLSASIHAPVEPVEFRVSTTFDAVYCLESVDRRVVEMPVVPPVS